MKISHCISIHFSVDMESTNLIHGVCPTMHQKISYEVYESTKHKPHRECDIPSFHMQLHVLFAYFSLFINILHHKNQNINR